MGGSHDKWSSDVLSVVYKVRIALGQNISSDDQVVNIKQEMCKYDSD
jgi:hypothetical protein